MILGVWSGQRSGIEPPEQECIYLKNVAIECICVSVCNSDPSSLLITVNHRSLIWLELQSTVSFTFTLNVCGHVPKLPDQLALIS